MNSFAPHRGYLTSILHKVTFSFPPNTPLIRAGKLARTLVIFSVTGVNNGADPFVALEKGKGAFVNPPPSDRARVAPSFGSAKVPFDANASAILVRRGSRKCFIAPYAPAPFHESATKRVDIRLTDAGKGAAKMAVPRKQISATLPPLPRVAVPPNRSVPVSRHIPFLAS